MKVNKVVGKVIPCPRFAGTKYRLINQLGVDCSMNKNKKLPKNIRNMPTYKSNRRQPYLLMQMPIIKLPTGVNKEGMVRRNPAFAVESPRTIWKNNGKVNR